MMLITISIMVMTKRPWSWERLKAGGEGDDRGWDGWMASQTQWTWIWVNSGSWRWTGRPGVLQSMGSQRVRHEWITELNWTEMRYLLQRPAGRHGGTPLQQPHQETSAVFTCLCPSAHCRSFCFGYNSSVVYVQNPRFWPLKGQP